MLMNIGISIGIMRETKRRLKHLSQFLPFSHSWVGASRIWCKLSNVCKLNEVLCRGKIRLILIENSLEPSWTTRQDFLFRLISVALGRSTSESKQLRLVPKQESYSLRRNSRKQQLILDDLVTYDVEAFACLIFVNLLNELFSEANCNGEPGWLRLFAVVWWLLCDELTTVVGR